MEMKKMKWRLRMKKFLYLLWLLVTGSLGAMSDSQEATLNQMSSQERLHFAIRHEETEVIAEILKVGGYKDNLEKINVLYNGQTHLYKAIEGGDLGVVELLINYGADVNRPNSRISGNGATPLHAAAQVCSVEIVGLLLNKGADKNSLDKSGHKPIHYANMRNEKSDENDRIRIMLSNNTTIY